MANSQRKWVKIGLNSRRVLKINRRVAILGEEPTLSRLVVNCTWLVVPHIEQHVVHLWDKAFEFLLQFLEISLAGVFPKILKRLIKLN